MTQEPEVERHEDQDDPDVGREPLPHVPPENEDVDSDHENDHRGHVQRRGCGPSHAVSVDPYRRAGDVSRTGKIEAPPTMSETIVRKLELVRLSLVGSVETQ